MLTDSFSRIIAVILLIIALFIYPVMLMFETQDELSRTVVFSEAVKFIEVVSNKGKISENNLKLFNHALMATGNLYDIELTHYKYLDYENEVSDSIGADYTITNHNSIIKEIEEDGEYKMSAYDLIEVEVKNKNKTMATRIQEMLYNKVLGTEKIYVKYGGVVKNEAQ